MSKDNTAPEAPAFEFIDLPEDDTSNEYDAIVVALVAAGPGKGYPITVPNAEVQRNVRRFSEAARRNDKTAKQVKRSIDGENTTVVFKLVDKIVRKNSKDGEGSATVDTEATE